MTAIILAIGIVSVIGLVLGLGLAFAAGALQEQADPRVEEVTAALPSVNCGACGYPGCGGYAEAIVNQGAPGNLCTPGGDAAAAAIAAIMGTQAEAVAGHKAFVRCGGGNCKLRFEYRGEPSCAAASLLFQGQKRCGSGCLGFGDCALVCPYRAISMIGGVAAVDRDLCVGCALCAGACPKGVIGMTEAGGKAINRCRSEASGPVARRQCEAGCIGCKLCEKFCPKRAIIVKDYLAHIDPALCDGCGLCLEKCPAKCLVML